MVKNTEIQRWIEAGKVLAQDPTARILCPKCQSEYLEVVDIRNPANPDELERIMRCPVCGAMNVLRLRVMSKQE